jgi:CrcB protein
MSVATWLGVGALGGAGAIARFLVDATVSGRLAGELPFGTLVVNASGALVLGILTGVALGANASLLFSTALVGSYTTFSTWMLETHRLAEEGEFAGGVANILGSLALGIAMAALGRWIAGGL